MKLRSEGVASRRVGEDLMVLDLNSSQYFAVGGSGAFILEILGERDLSEDEIVREVVATYSVEEERARADVAGFVRRLGDAGLLDASAGRPGSA